MNPTRKNRIIAAAEIGDVRLVSLEANTNIRNAEQVDNPTVKLEIGAGVADGPDTDGVFFVSTNFHCSIESPETDDPYVTVSASFELRYRIPTDLEYSKDELNVFAESNAVFNAWPYLREIFQSMLGRMGLPPIMLPLYRMATRPSKKAPLEESTTQRTKI